MPADEKTPVEEAPHYFLESAEKLATRFATSLDAGLTHTSVTALQLLHGPNVLAGSGGVSWVSILSLQFFNGMTIVLSVFSAISLPARNFLPPSCADCTETDLLVIADSWPSLSRWRSLLTSKRESFSSSLFSTLLSDLLSKPSIASPLTLLPHPSLVLRPASSSVEVLFAAALRLTNKLCREYGSAKTMDSLRDLASPSATVYREGDVVIIPSYELVVGDIVQLKTGDVVPADLRLISASNFETDEALLTGESLPVQKNHLATWNDKHEDESWSPTDVGVGGQFSSSHPASCIFLTTHILQIESTWPFLVLPSPRDELPESSSRLEWVPRLVRSPSLFEKEPRKFELSAEMPTDKHLLIDTFDTSFCVDSTASVTSSERTSERPFIDDCHNSRSFSSSLPSFALYVSSFDALPSIP